MTAGCPGFCGRNGGRFRCWWICCGTNKHEKTHVRHWEAFYRRSDTQSFVSLTFIARFPIVLDVEAIWTLAAVSFGTRGEKTKVRTAPILNGAGSVDCK